MSGSLRAIPHFDVFTYNFQVELFCSLSFTFFFRIRRLKRYGNMAQYKGAASEAGRAMQLMKKREKEREQLEQLKQKIAEVCNFYPK